MEISLNKIYTALLLAGMILGAGGFAKSLAHTSDIELLNARTSILEQSNRDSRDDITYIRNKLDELSDRLNDK